MVKTDFEKDDIICTSRWIPYLTHSKHCIVPRPKWIERLTGYKTRQAALAAVKAYICEEGYTNETRS